jgi:hypothetical protein
MSNIVKQVSDELSRIFRHMLPGLAVLGTAVVSHPSWFPEWATFDQGWHIAILAAVALTVGNVWYVIHRYTIHQIIDFCCYVVRHRKVTGYVAWFGNHVDRSFHVPDTEARLREHVHFRSAQIIFLFIIAESILVFSMKPQPCTFLARHQPWSWAAGIVLFLWCTFIQYPLGYSLDLLVATRYGQKGPA